MSNTELDEFIENDFEFEDESDNFSLLNGIKVIKSENKKLN